MPWRLKRKKGSKTEYIINIDNESEADELSKKELTGLMKAPRISDIVYRYSRYQFEATLEFLKQCDAKYGLLILGSDELKEVAEQIYSEIPASDTSSFSFDKRSKSAKKNADQNKISLDSLFDRFDELHNQGVGDKTEERQALRALIRTYIEQEKLDILITLSTSNEDLLDLIEEALEKGIPPSEEGDEDAKSSPSPAEMPTNERHVRGPRNLQRRSFN